MSVRFRSGMSRGVGSLLLVVSIAVLAAVAFGVDAGSAKMSRATACGGVPNLPPNDPNNLLAAAEAYEGAAARLHGLEAADHEEPVVELEAEGEGTVQGRDRLVCPVELVECLHASS